MPTPKEKRTAATERLGRRKPARSLGARFANAGTRSGSPTYPVMLQVRVSDPLAAALADYGNANSLSASDTVRHLLEVGLEKETSNE